MCDFKKESVFTFSQGPFCSLWFLSLNFFFQEHCPFCQFVSMDTIDSLPVIYVDLRRDNSNKL